MDHLDRLVVVSATTSATPRTVKFVRPLHSDTQGRPKPDPRGGGEGHAHSPPEHASWPVSTSCWCWHCCHPMEGKPVPLATAYESRTDLFTLLPATFCSWSCAKTFARDLPGSARVASVQTLLRKRACGRLEGTTGAPPRCMLQVFGGSMTIGEFRRCSGENVSYCTMPERFVVQTICVERTEPRAEKKRSSKQSAEEEAPITANKSAAAAPAPTLKLKRSKPLPNQKQQLCPFFETLLQKNHL